MVSDLAPGVTVGDENDGGQAGIGTTGGGWSVRGEGGWRRVEDSWSNCSLILQTSQTN